ncbi:MAG: tRNA (N(6)-L-threonylcarbamoyladenosine(37)-C(2))-methylthiotransferase MtaB, partial [Candidatus Latescibacterota bacterium]
MSRIAFYVLGCKLNQYELRAIQEAFGSRGWETVPFGERAEVYLVHTCAVTGRSARQCRQMLMRARRFSPDALVVATGCYA